MDGYIFSWRSTNNTDRLIRVTPQNGFSGTYLKRNLGGAPLLRYEVNEGVIGSSLNFLAESQINREFSKFYTSNPYDFSVELMNGFGTTVWKGFIVTEVYSEPDIAPPYDVSITAVDGLGELKNATYHHSSDSLYNVFRTLLHSAQDTDLPIFSCINYTNSQQTSVANFLARTSMDLSDRDGDTCYDVLQDLLTTLHCRIMYRSGFNHRRMDGRPETFGPGWYIFNENSLMSEDGDAVFFIENRATDSESFSRGSFGSMGSNAWWPIDHLTTDIEAACKSVVVTSETTFKELVKDADCEEGSASVWNVVSPATHQPGFFRLMNVRTPSVRQGSVGQIIHLGEPVSDDLSLVLQFTGQSHIGSDSARTGVANPTVLVTVKGTSTSAGPFWLTIPDGCTEYSWKAGAEIENVLEFDATPLRAKPAEITMLLPFTSDNLWGSDTGANTITNIEVTVKSDVWNGSVQLMGMHLKAVNDSTKSETKIIVTNGARSVQQDREIMVPAIPASDTRQNLKKIMHHVLVNTSTGAGIYSWGSEGKDYNEFIGTEYAKTYALPRCRKRGTLNTPMGEDLPPMLMQSDLEGLGYMLLAFDWDMLNDEVSISEMVEIPGGQLSPSGWVLGDNLPMILRA